MHGPGYLWNRNSCWSAGFGHPDTRNSGMRPYWISFTNEADASIVLLQMEQQ